LRGDGPGLLRRAQHQAFALLVASVRYKTEPAPEALARRGIAVKQKIGGTAFVRPTEQYLAAVNGRKKHSIFFAKGKRGQVLLHKLRTKSLILEGTL
jgi:hypothetical protein